MLDTDKDPMKHVNLRLPPEVVEYFKKFRQPTVAMRNVLVKEFENNK